ncbi:GNAT family N-acetyltransferase [Albirhodobacter sp. R86504]|uniref:GNAT family N-acetyltransferase n=1 Tax=Albirhodobacter sp. R86504 TaxID=3093848 RepID=UPI00366D633D
MPLVTVEGRLICKNEAERASILAHLPAHMRATVGEEGCLYFDVLQDPVDTMLWHVSEAFIDRAAYRHHQTRTAASPWAQATSGVRRDYKIADQRPDIMDETAKDIAEISHLITTAFAREDEARLVNSLRVAFDLPISLVAKIGRAYLGHIAFSPMTAPFKALALAPLAVRETMRRQGLGGDLIRAGLLQARAKGFEGVFVLGDPDFYSRFGFQPATGFTGAFAGEHLMVLDLTRQGLVDRGELTWAPAFNALT